MRTRGSVTLAQMQEEMRGRWEEKKEICPAETEKPVEPTKCIYCRIELARLNKRSGELMPCRECNKKVGQLQQYGLSLWDFKRMMEEQNGNCAICDGELKKPCVDHCHELSHVRGILCPHCNTGLGFFRDDTSVLENAAKYLNKNLLSRKWCVQQDAF